MTILIGHGGASAIAPANTIASFDAARRAKRRHDRVRRSATGIADAGSAPRPAGSPPRLPHSRGRLDHLAQPAFSRLALNVDVKGRGCESALVATLRRHGLLEQLFTRIAELGVAGVATNDPARLRPPDRRALAAGLAGASDR